MNRFLPILLLISSFSYAQEKPTADLTKKVNEFDLYVQSSLKQWEVPGAAVVVVSNGQVIHKKAYGVREIGKNDPVTTETMFACASTTKAMTATCMGILVDEGKVKWDDPVISYLPEFQLYDPFVTRDLRIRDLFTHNSGVGNTDYLLWLMDIPDEEVLYRMRLVKPDYSVRAGFVYQNIFYVVAGKVIEVVSGKPWEIFIQERIFTPLQMTRTVPKMKYIKDNNQTKPHYKIDNVIQPIGYSRDESVGPAGAVWSSIDDMGKWVICMIDSGKYKGGRLLKPKTWTEMFRPQVLVPTEAGFYPTARITKPNWKTYGLGWYQHDYKGKKLNFHTGSLSGLVALHAQLPDEKLGYYFFGNYDHAEVRHALMYKTLDHFALGGNSDWNAEFFKLYAGIKAGKEKEEKEIETKRIPNTKPSLPLTGYAGNYSDPLYGEIEITLEGTKLVANVNNVVKATLDHWNFDTFRGPYSKAWYGQALCTFTLNAKGKVEKLNFDGIEIDKKGGQ